MKKLSKLGISPTPWMANGHWLDCADGEFFAFKDSDEGYANAKLTAAAPKMYKKAWELITAFDKRIMTPKHIEALRATLVEASGEKEESK